MEDQHLTGTPYADHLSGTDGNDLIEGLGGADVLVGNGGHDTLDGGAGNDLLRGGAGSDVYLFGRGGGNDWIEPGYDGAGSDTLRLGAGIAMSDLAVTADPHSPSNLVLRLNGSYDAVTLIGHLGAPDGQQLARVEFADGSYWDGAALLRQLDASDDYLHGTPGADMLSGGLGRDHLDGGDGSDILAGNGGMDVLFGGGGADTFLFGRGDGQDHAVVDQDGDRIELGAGIGMADVRAERSGMDLLLTLKGSSDSLRVSGYFDGPLEVRPLVRFADGLAWDGLAIERKLSAYGDYLAGDADGGVLDGGAGNDHLQGGMGDDALYGDSGDDILGGGAGGSDLFLYGRGDGHDTVLASWDEARDSLQFGANITMADLHYERRGSTLLLTLGEHDAVEILDYFGFHPEQAPLIRFADGSYLDGASIARKLATTNDYLPGTGGADVLAGGDGHDYLVGDEGDDILHGDGGHDMLRGDGGNDTFLFGRGDGYDEILPAWSASQEQGHDRLVLGADINVADLQLARSGPDLLLALAGSADRIRVIGYFDANQDMLSIMLAGGLALERAAVERIVDGYGGAQSGTTDADLLVGGAGQDHLFGADGDDTLYGDGGDDLLDGGMGADTYLFGRGDGADMILAGQADAGPDRLEFGTGIGMGDVLAERSAGDLVLRLAGSADQVLISGYFYAMPHERMAIAFHDGATWDAETVERKLFASDDYLGGTEGNDVLDGGAGDDMLHGAGGNDILHGDDGRDMLDGGEGADLFLFGRGDGHDTVLPSYNGWSGPTPVRDSVLFGSAIVMADVDVTRTEDGALLLSLDQGRDSIRLDGYFQQALEERATIRFADGARWDGAAIGRKLDTSHDVLAGSAGADALDGGLGMDVLDGMDGDDILCGDAGDDMLNGGAGADTYLFGRGDGKDTIMAEWSDHADAHDLLQFGYGIAVADVAFARDGGDLVMSLVDTTDSVHVSGYFGGAQQWLGVRFADGTAWDQADLGLILVGVPEYQA